jgi:hypothetical protein
MHRSLLALALALSTLLACKTPQGSQSGLRDDSVDAVPGPDDSGEAFDPLRAASNAPVLDMLPTVPVPLTLLVDYRQGNNGLVQLSKIRVDGARAYVSNGGGGRLGIIDTATGKVLALRNYKQKMYSNADAEVTGIAFDSQYIYAAIGDAGVVVVDKSSLKTITSLPVGHWSNAVAVDQNRVYVGDDANILYFDKRTWQKTDSVSMPDTGCGTPCPVTGIAPAGDTLYVAAGRLAAVNVNSKTVQIFPWLKAHQPDDALHAIVNVPATARDLVFRGGRLYVADDFHGVGVFDAASQGLVTYYQTQPTKAYVSGVDLVDNTVYTGNGAQGLIVFQLPSGQ